MSSPHRAPVLLAAALLCPSCGPAPAPNDAKLLEKSEALKVKKPTTQGVRNYDVSAVGSEVGFEMDAPFERIRGRLPSSGYRGRLLIDTANIANTTGLVVISLGGLELFQRQADEQGKFGEEVKSDMQNDHARNWLEIGEDAPEEQRSKNLEAEFSISSIVDVDHNDLSKLDGDKRTVNFTAKGNLRIHQRVAQKSIKMQAVFNYEGERARSVEIRALQPLPVDLAAHDIRPRTAFDRLAKKTLEAMASKVSQIAQVEIKIYAQLVGPKRK